jgi:membrane protein
VAEGLRQADIQTPGIDCELGWRTQLRRTFLLRRSEWTALLWEAYGNWFTHNVPRLGASLAFYTLLSLAPLLVVIVSVAALVFGQEAAQGRLVWEIQGLIGRQGAETVQALLSAAQSTAAGIAASILSSLALFYGATAVVAELRNSLNTIWCVRQKEQSTWMSIMSVVLERTKALAVVVAVGFLLLVSLAVHATLNALGEQFHAALSIPSFLLSTFDSLVFYSVITFLFALMHKYLPDLHLEWRDVLPGAVFTALLFTLGRNVIGMYIGRSAVTSTYGAAGSLVALLLWVYYSAQIFYLGAELTRAYAQHFGSRPCDRIGREVKLATSLAEVDNADNAVDLEEPQPKIEIATSLNEIDRCRNGQNQTVKAQSENLIEI